MSTIVTDAAAIERIVGESVRRAMESALPPLVRAATQKPWLTKADLKALTGWSDRTIQHLRDTRQIPFSQHGRKITYPTDGIEAFLQANGVPARETTGSGHE